MSTTPLPNPFGNLDTVLVQGRYRFHDGGIPASGFVTFTPSVVLIDTGEATVILPKALRADLDENGEFSIRLAATDDPDIVPTGWVYAVKETITSAGGVQQGRSFNMAVPYTAELIDMSVVVPAQAVNPQTQYATLAQLLDVETRLTVLDGVGASENYILTWTEENGAVWLPAGSASHPDLTAHENMGLATEAALADEVAARTSADDVLAAAIMAETSDREAAIADEASSRSLADTALADAVDTERDERIAGDQALATALDDETSARTAAITNEANDRSLADSALGDRIDDEEAARIAADNALDALIADVAGDLVAEGTARSDADTALGGRIDDAEAAISAETSARTSADTALASDIAGKANVSHEHPADDLLSGAEAEGRIMEADGEGGVRWRSAPGTGGGGVTDHNDLTGRTAANQHSIGSVTNLQAVLDIKADLVNDQIPSSQIPNIAIGERFIVNDEWAMLNLDAQILDIAVRTDEDDAIYLLVDEDPSVLEAWHHLPLAGAGDVVSVNGQTGVVVLSAADVGASSLSHKSRHAVGGADVLTPADIGAPASSAVADIVTISQAAWTALGNGRPATRLYLFTS